VAEHRSILKTDQSTYYPVLVSHQNRYKTPLNRCFLFTSTGNIVSGVLVVNSAHRPINEVFTEWYISMNFLPIEASKRSFVELFELAMFSWVEQSERRVVESGVEASRALSKWLPLKVISRSLVVAVYRWTCVSTWEHNRDSKFASIDQRFFGPGISTSDVVSGLLIFICQLRGAAEYCPSVRNASERSVKDLSFSVKSRGKLQKLALLIVEP